MGRSDVYPRFCRRTDGLRMREHRRKEQNEERGGSPLAFTPVAPPAVADYHSCRYSWRDHLHMQKIRFAEVLDPIVAADKRYSREAYVFLGDALDYTTKQQKKTKGAAGQTAKKAEFTSATCRKRVVRLVS